MADILVAGVAVADIVMYLDEFPRRAEKYRAGDARVTLGGCAANAALSIARHGGAARLAARLGEDMMGDVIVGLLESERVNIDLCDRRNGARSSFSSIFVDRAGERQIMNFRGKGLAETLDLSTAPRIDAVLADNRWPPLTTAAITLSRNRGVPSIIDAEAPFSADTVQGATHIAFSMQGLSAYAPGKSVEAAVLQAGAEFAAWVAVTDGPEGVWFTEGGGVSHLPSYPVRAVDTLGAGDVWHGTFALRIAEGASERAAMRFANAAAALKCLNVGGAMGCPDRPATEAFLKERS